MQRGFICVAGIRQPDGPHVRPVLNGQRLGVNLLSRNGGPFDIGNVVELGPCQAHPSPPEVEDRIFERARTAAVGALTGVAFWQLLDRVAEDSFGDLFGDALHEQSNGAAVDVGVGTSSLGCLRPSSIALYVNGWGKLRAGLSDGAWNLDLSVTDLRFYEGDNQTVRQDIATNVQQRIEAGVRVIASLGLARAFRAGGDTQSRHWLQVNNIHLEDDPVWRLG